jgi:hypothetical protein
MVLSAIIWVMMALLSTFETSVSFCETDWRSIPEESSSSPS